MTQSEVQRSEQQGTSFRAGSPGEPAVDSGTPPPSNGMDRDPKTGRFLVGHKVSVAHGLCTDRQLPGWEDDPTFLPNALADQGDDLPTRVRAQLEYRALIHRDIRRLSYALATRGVFDGKGRLRERWLARRDGMIATALRIDQLLGLARKPKVVESPEAWVLSGKEAAVKTDS